MCHMTHNSNVMFISFNNTMLNDSFVVEKEGEETAFIDQHAVSDHN